MCLECEKKQANLVGVHSDGGKHANSKRLTLLEIKQNLLLVRHSCTTVTRVRDTLVLKYGGGGVVHNSCTIVVYGEYSWKEPSEFRQG